MESSSSMSVFQRKTKSLTDLKNWMVQLLKCEVTITGTYPYPFFILPTQSPSAQPSIKPSISKKPSAKPSARPTSKPTKRPTAKPTQSPTKRPPSSINIIITFPSN